MKLGFLICSWLFSIHAYAGYSDVDELKSEEVISIRIQSSLDTDASNGANVPLSIDRQSYNFGRVPVNSTRYASYRVTNTGETFLTFDSAFVSGVGYSAWHTCTEGLEAKATCTFEIRYWPPFQGLHSGQFELNFVEDSSIVIDLWGEGVPF